MKQEIRIIGGLYRGKKINFPAIDGLRPTPDRVKETLFNWLMHHIQDARCLDVFAGSGSLGLEAFSRGASKVVLLEHSPIAYANLKKISAQFQSTKLHVQQTDARVYLQQCKEEFDLIFLDPPFSEDYLLPCLENLAQNPVLASGGLVYVESPTLIELNPYQWELLKQKQAGQVFFALYKKL